MEIAVYFNYKGQDILVRKMGRKYQMGIRSLDGVDIWLEKGVYNSLELAKTSGREYTRIVIDEMLLDRKRELKTHE